MQARDSRGSFSGQYEVIANNSGVYICKMEVIYPPPFKDSCHSTKVVVAGKTQYQHFIYIYDDIAYLQYVTFMNSVLVDS